MLGFAMLTPTYVLICCMALSILQECLVIQVSCMKLNLSEAT